MILETFNLKRDALIKLSGILVTISSISGFFHFGVLYYFVLAIIAVMFVTTSPFLSFRVGNFYIVIFLIVCFFSLIFNTPPAYFNAWNRLYVFTLVLLVISPIVVNKKIEVIRTKLLIHAMNTCIILSIGSFIAYFLGINLFVRKGEIQAIGAGKFSGLMNHSMILGPVAAISAIIVIYYYFRASSKNRKVLYLAIAFICLMSSLLSASRVAVGAGVVGIIFFLIRYYKKQMSKFILIIIALVGLLAATFPLWGGFTSFLQEKQEANLEMGSALYSREKKINARISEFISSPIIGIGFNTINPALDVVDISNGQIEPGSSWLEIPAMTGILGLMIFMIIAYQTFQRAWRNHNDLYSCLLVGLLAFFFIHMLGEGWILSVRAFLSFLFWLTVGVTFSDYEIN